jgi:hypothetical protein
MSNLRRVFVVLSRLVPSLYPSPQSINIRKKEMEKMKSTFQRMLFNGFRLRVGSTANRSDNPQSLLKSHPEKTACEESKRLADQARASQNLWDIMIPERNIGVFHPFFLVLLSLTLSLHFYNRHRDRQEDEELRKRRLDKSDSKYS